MSDSTNFRSFCPLAAWSAQRHGVPGRRQVARLIETSNSYGRELLQGIRAWTREHESWAMRFVEQGRRAAVPDWLRAWRAMGSSPGLRTRKLGLLESAGDPAGHV